MKLSLEIIIDNNLSPEKQQEVMLKALSSVFSRMSTNEYVKYFDSFSAGSNNPFIRGITVNGEMVGDWHLTK